MDKHPPTWHRSVRQRYASVNPRGRGRERARARRPGDRVRTGGELAIDKACQCGRELAPESVPPGREVAPESVPPDKRLSARTLGPAGGGSARERAAC